MLKLPDIARDRKILKKNRNKNENLRMQENSNNNNKYLYLNFSSIEQFMFCWKQFETPSLYHYICIYFLCEYVCVCVFVCYGIFEIQ